MLLASHSHAILRGTSLEGNFGTRALAKKDNADVDLPNGRPFQLLNQQDEQIKADIEALSGRVTDLEDGLNDLLEQVETNTADIAEVQGDLEAGIQQLNNDIQALALTVQGNKEELEGKLSLLQSALDTLRRSTRIRLRRLRNLVQENQGSIQDLKDADIDIIEEYTDMVSEINGRITTLAGIVDDNNAFVEDFIDNEYSLFKETSIDQIAALQLIDVVHFGELNLLNEELQALTSRVNTLDLLKSRVTALEGADTTIHGLINDIQADLSQAQSDLAQKQQQISSTCPSGSAIQQIHSDGSLTCEPVVNSGSSGININHYYKSKSCSSCHGLEYTYACPQGQLVGGGTYWSTNREVPLRYVCNHPMANNAWEGRALTSQTVSYMYMTIHVRCLVTV